MESESPKISSLPSSNFQDGDAPKSTMMCAKCSPRKLSEARKEKKRQATKAWRIRNKEYLAAYEKAYRASKADHYKALYKANKEKHRERARAQRKIWEQNNPDKKKAHDAAHYRKHSEKIKEQVKAYVSANYEKVNARRKERYRTEEAALKRQSYRPKRCEIAHSRRVTKMASSTPEERKRIADWFKQVSSSKRVVCYWCSKTIRKGKLNFDHITPVSKGGAHTLANLCVSCERCNKSKHDKDITRWNQEIAQPVLL